MITHEPWKDGNSKRGVSQTWLFREDGKCQNPVSSNGNIPQWTWNFLDAIDTIQPRIWESMTSLHAVRNSMQSNLKHSTFLRWAGSKRALIPRLLDCLPESYDRYVEPFVGSGCLFFHLQPRNALLADFNSELINCYKVLKASPDTLHELADRFETTEVAYYKIRETTDSESSAEFRAGRFLYLNSYCFNGVYRTNGNGRFNVPRGTKTRGVPTLECLRSCSRSLKNARVKCQDYAKTLAQAREGDFIYLDPPYAKAGGRNRGEYGVNSFSIDDEPILIAELKQIAARRISFLLSYRASSAFIRRLPSDWRIARLKIKRNVAGFARARRDAVEILVCNYGKV